MSGWKESHWRRPFLELESQPDRVKLTLPMFSVLPDSILNELNTLFDNVSHLTQDELTALSFCLIEGSISNQRLQYVLNMHSVDITNLLKKLCAENYLESDNNGRWTTYKIKTKGATFDKKGATFDKKGATSDKKGATSEYNSDNPVDTIKKGATSEKELSRFHGKNLKREDLELIILKLCKDQYIKKEELAMQLGKSENYIRNKILPYLLKKGKLVKRFPYTHNHPGQGYKTSEAYAKKL